MNDSKFDYFIEETNKRLSEIQTAQIQILIAVTELKRLNGLPTRVEKIEKKVDRRHWKQAGANGVIAAIVAGLVAFFGRG